MITKGWKKIKHRHGMHSYSLKLPLIDVSIHSGITGGLWFLYINENKIKEDKDPIALIKFADNFIIEEYKKLKEVLG